MFLSSFKGEDKRILEVGHVLFRGVDISLCIPTLFSDGRKVRRISIPNILERIDRSIKTTRTDIETLEIEGLIRKIGKRNLLRETMKEQAIKNKTTFIGDTRDGMDPREDTVIAIS